MEELQKLKEYLIISVKRNGDKPLTLQHLINIISLMANKRLGMEREEERNELDDMMVREGENF